MSLKKKDPLKNNHDPLSYQKDFTIILSHHEFAITVEISQPFHELFLSKCKQGTSLHDCGLIFFSLLLLLSHVRLFRDPMDCSTPDFPVLHYLAEFAQTHIL